MRIDGHADLHLPIVARPALTCFGTVGDPVRVSGPTDDDQIPPESAGLSRRRVLGAAGVGAAVVGTGGLLARSGGSDTPAAAAERDDRDRLGASVGHFSRLVDAPPFAEASPELTEALVELGRPGGLMDADDPLDLDPRRLVDESDVNPRNLDNPAIPAGITYAGQFLDHDITRDAGTTLGEPVSLGRTVNLRSAKLDLDPVYGDGPIDQPTIYDPDDPIRFRLDDGGRFEDLPRDPYRRALIADSRNDENLIINGFHCAWLLFHNAVLDEVLATGLDDMAAFDEARRLVQWHYQWLLVHEWLPAFVGQAMVDDVMTNGRRVYNPRLAQIPVEFQVGAFRMGHSMVRPAYRANNDRTDGEPFVGLVFDPNSFTGVDPDSMAGTFRAPRRFIGWENFFDFGDGSVVASKQITPRVSTPLHGLPFNTLPRNRGEVEGPHSLPTRNLLRHITFGIPSAQVLAAALGEPVLAPADLAELDQFGANLQASTPLFYYVLREAEVVADGAHLGPVGGRILAEVFLGMLDLDPMSYRSAEPDWTPTVTVADTALGFRTTDMLAAAGVDPDGRAAFDASTLAPSPDQWMFRRRVNWRD